MKILDRYRTWPWANQMEFLKPFLQFANTASNVANQSIRDRQDDINENSEDGARNTEQDEVTQEQHQQQRQHNSASRPAQRETPTTSKKRKSEETSSVSTAQQVLTYLQSKQNKINTDHSDIELIFMGYAKTVKKFSPRRQAMVKFRFSQILLEEELAQQTENEQNAPGSSASAYVVPSSSPSPLSLRESTPGHSGSYQGSNRPTSSSSWYEDFGSSLDKAYENL